MGFHSTPTQQSFRPSPYGEYNSHEPESCNPDILLGVDQAIQGVGTQCTNQGDTWPQGTSYTHLDQFSQYHSVQSPNVSVAPSSLTRSSTEPNIPLEPNPSMAVTMTDMIFLESSITLQDMRCYSSSDNFSPPTLPGVYCQSAASAGWPFPQIHADDSHGVDASARIHVPCGQNIGGYFSPLPVMTTIQNSDMESPRLPSPPTKALVQVPYKLQADDDSKSNPHTKRKPTSSSHIENMAIRGNIKRPRPSRRSASPSKATEGPSTKAPSTAWTTPLALDCHHCDFTCQEKASFDKHMKTHIRPFICVFHYAGCTRTFAKKNEWKRHVLKQHICLEYYHCNYSQCAAAKQRATNGRAKDLPTRGRIFKRKDLHMQHVRRMHLSNNKTEDDDGQTKQEIAKLQQQALRTRCQLPREMICPAENCDLVFRGDKAWDERMEHAARHLEAASMGREPEVRFGGSHDTCLSEWAERPDVDVVRRFQGCLVLNDPLQDCDEASRASPGSTSYEEDAEGEPA